MKERFIQTPNLPKGGVSLVVCDGRINNEIEDNIKKLGIRIIKTNRQSSLYEAVSYHPDIQFHHLGDNKIVIAPNIDDKFYYALEQEGFEIIIGKKYINSKYPEDVPYNVARIGNFAVLNIKYTDEILLDELIKRNVKLIDVKQGYAKCSICIVSENAIITSDRGIHKKAILNSIHSLLINPGHIELFELNYGFIGGCSGFISKDVLSFYGRIESHPDFYAISQFLNKFEKKYQNLSKGNLIDYGTLIPLKEYSIM
ncbi:DUF6873 family GME fold protein [Thermobrachium celere]|uniref:DUF6873 family GME fold protein n=1 Tax=Thermobrachium celere TaxID=53422 RepID=UPI00194065EB|nr:hypothetical protein [Thermobrachium celere]GFR36695.1 hypothetical protein TCEA9_25070 [Thermobrachium celere]